MLAKATTLDCGRLMNELCFLNPVPKSFKSTRISQRKRYSMECPFLCPLLAVMILTVSLTAQVRPRPVADERHSGASGTSTFPSAPDLRNDGPDTIPAVSYVSGKVKIDDGTALPSRILIQSNCKGTVRTEGYTDARGGFSFEFGNARNRTLSEPGLASDTNPNATSPADVRRNTPRDARDCELKAILSGFVSKVVDLRSRMPEFGNFDVGTIFLHRTAVVEGATINIKIPDMARTHYEKGLEKMKKGDLQAAQQLFRKAVEEYPDYASAWLELGRTQNHSADAAGARQSFQRSIAADPKLMAPYQELAQLAARDKQWQEVAETTDQLLKLDAQSFPEFWFYNCVAKYHLGNLEDAEKSAFEGIRIDTQHHVPKTEYVLGVILARKHDYAGSAEHLHRYLALSPNAPEAADAKKKLAEIEQTPDASLRTDDSSSGQLSHPK